MELTADHQEEPRPRASLAVNIQTWILGIIGTLLCASFGFFWNINATIATMKEQSVGRDKSIDMLQQGINDIRLDLKTSNGTLQDLKERQIRLEDALPKAK